jgi:hypothetical protein
VGQRGGIVYFKIEPSILGSLHSLFIFELCANQNGMLPKKIKNKNWEALHLINRRDDYVPNFISLPLA